MAEQLKSKIIEFRVDNSIIPLYNSGMSEQNWLTKDGAVARKPLVSIIFISILNISLNMIFIGNPLYFKIPVLSIQFWRLSVAMY